MQSRKFHAFGACAIFFGIAHAYGWMTSRVLDSGRVLAWSIVGVCVYISLCGLFGFDPHRTKLATLASPLTHYIDRWELRLGQATLGMLGCVVVAARFVDPQHFVTAVVCGTLSAWTYFTLRLYRGGYRTASDQCRSG